MTLQVPSGFPLWSDEPAGQNLLSFRAVASTLAGPLFDDTLDPIAIRLPVHGHWQDQCP